MHNSVNLIVKGVSSTKAKQTVEEVASLVVEGDPVSNETTFQKLYSGWKGARLVDMI